MKPVVGMLYEYRLINIVLSLFYLMYLHVDMIIILIGIFK